MGNQEKHITEAEYLRYLNDEMTDQERNAFEKLLQKYPFEAEALEGLEEISASQFTTDMADLKQRLGEKTKKSNRMVWWAAAASIVILVTSGVLWYNLDQRAMAPQVAEQMATEKSAKESITNTREKEDVVSVTTSPDNEKGGEKGEKKSRVDTDKSEAPDTEIEAPTEITIVEDDVGVSEEVELSEPHTKTSDTEISETKPVSKPEARPANEMIVIEDVTTQNQVFEEDVEMEYDFNEPAITRQAKSLTSGASQNQISAPTLEAQPMMEQEKFNAWLKSQAILEPDAEKDSVLVSMKLYVDETGKITQFENSNQANQKYFRKARKIIQSGPPWQPAMANGIAIKSEVELKVVFRKH